MTTILKKTLNKGLSIILSVILALSSSLTAQAKTGDRYRLHEEGNWIAIGGRNEFDEVKAASREETERLESTLILNDYILVTTDKMAILYDDYIKFRDSHSFWFSAYIVDKEPYWLTKKLYVYKPSFDDYMEQLDSPNGLKRYTIEEINNSSVLIDYGYWDSVEAVGTISDIFNDNIPSYCDTGYMEIDANINCEVKLLQAGTRRYYVFYVHKNTPFIVRLPIGCYHVVGVNNTDIPDNIDNSGESTLPYNNQIQIQLQHTIDNPYIIQLNELSEKYRLKDVDISGKPDYSVADDIEFYPVEVIDEGTSVISNTDATAEEKQPIDTAIWILLISICLVGIIWVALTIIKRKKEGENDDDT
jgi:hypothetical protein